MRHFTRKTLTALTRKGVTIYGTQLIPDMSSSMPFANGSTGYKVNNNGTGQVLSYKEVLELAA